MHIQRKAAAKTKFEYGCDLRRIFPSEDLATPFWGLGIASVRPGGATTPDCHDELEAFLVLSGSGRIEVEDESGVLSEGDVVVIPKNHKHRVWNLSGTEPLVFISIYWDSPEARERMRRVLDEGRDDR